MDNPRVESASQTYDVQGNGTNAKRELFRLVLFGGSVLRYTPCKVSADADQG